MVAEILQEYIFVFNTFLSKKLYIFIFNQKKNFFCKNFGIQRKYIFIQSKYTVFKKLLFSNRFFFRVKKHVSIQLKKNVFNEIFYSVIIGSQIWSSIC